MRRCRTTHVSDGDNARPNDVHVHHTFFSMHVATGEKHAAKQLGGTNEWANNGSAVHFLRNVHAAGARFVVSGQAL